MEISETDLIDFLNGLEVDKALQKQIVQAHHNRCFIHELCLLEGQRERLLENLHQAQRFLDQMDLLIENLARKIDSCPGSSRTAPHSPCRKKKKINEQKDTHPSRYPGCSCPH